MIITKGAQSRLTGGQERSKDLVLRPKQSKGYLVMAIMASLVLSFTVLGGTILPAEAAEKTSNGNDHASSASSASAVAEPTTNNNLATSSSEQQDQQQPAISDSNIASRVIAAEDKDTITEGENQTAYVAVIGADHKPVPNATVSATVFFGKSIEEKFTGTTQDDGMVSFTWEIGNHSKTGLIGIDIKAEAPGYSTGYTNLVFKYKD